MKLMRYNQYIKEMKDFSKIPIPQDIKDISDAYIKAGKDIFLVGGCVRDFIKGVKPKDWDLVTNALPDESKEILKGFRVSDEQGKNFGVLRVYTKDEPEGYEIASYRRDISKGRDTKGDDQKVEMGDGVTIEDDCRRRDLSINALFYDIKNEKIVDLVGGVDDIKTGTIRAVGDASQRFIEDRLRIMRIFRFTSRMGGKIHIDTANAIKTDNRLRGVGPGEDVSPERIWDEIKKSWSQVKDFRDYLNLITEFDMWPQIFPNSKINTEFVDSKDFPVVIANLFKYESTDGLEKKLVQDYKIESDISTKVVFLIRLLQLTPDSAFDLYKSKLQCHIDDSTIFEWFKVLDIKDTVKLKFLKYKPSTSAQDLMEKGFKGKALGDEIKRLEVEKFMKMI